MKRFFFTPGPSQLYFTVEEHLKSALTENVPSISHRSAAFQEIYRHTTDLLKELFRLPAGYHIFFTGSATEIWERSIQNLVEYESCHFVNGAFSQRYAGIAENLGRKTSVIRVSEGKVVDVESVLITESCELIALTQNETSTGASHALGDVEKIRKGFPNQLISLDIVSCAPYSNIDYSLVDMAYLSVQKCFGLPAGLGVWIANERCIQKSETLLGKGMSIGSYHSLPELLAKSQKNQTPETPNVLGIYLLGKVAEDMLAKGLDMIRREIDYKAAVLYNAFEKSEFLSPFVKDPAHQSKTTLVAEVAVLSRVILNKLAEKGMIIGSGYGPFKERHIRIANFPTHSKEQVEVLADELLMIGK